MQNSFSSALGVLEVRTCSRESSNPQMPEALIAKQMRYVTHALRRSVHRCRPFVIMSSLDCSKLRQLAQKPFLVTSPVLPIIAASATSTDSHPRRHQAAARLDHTHDPAAAPLTFDFHVPLLPAPRAAITALSNDCQITQLSWIELEARFGWNGHDVRVFVAGTQGHINAILDGR